MKPRPIAPRSPVMLALDILEGRVKVPEKKDAPHKTAAKKKEKKE